MANLTEEDFVVMAKILRDTCLGMITCDGCPFEDTNSTEKFLPTCLINGPYGWKLEKLGRGNEE